MFSIISKGALCFEAAKPHHHENDKMTYMHMQIPDCGKCDRTHLACCLATCSKRIRTNDIIVVTTMDQQQRTIKKRKNTESKDPRIKDMREAVAAMQIEYAAAIRRFMHALQQHDMAKLIA